MRPDQGAANTRWFDDCRRTARLQTLRQSIAQLTLRRHFCLHRSTATATQKNVIAPSLLCLHSLPSLTTMNAQERAMATLTIRNLDARLKERLRIRAARNGHSMEAELRQIVRDALANDRNSEPTLAEAIRRRFLPFGGVDDLEPHPPAPLPAPASFDR
jgi:plasmid stability protein